MNPTMEARPKEVRPDYVDGFLQYDVFPEKSFAARGWEREPRFGSAVDVRLPSPKLLRTLAWNCDGTRLAGGSEGASLRIWETRADKAGIAVDSTTALLPTSTKANPHTGSVGSLAWSTTDPNILVSGCKFGNKTVAVWDVTQPAAPLATFKVPADVLHIAFHPTLDQFAAVCPQRTDEVYFFWRVERDGEWTWEKRNDVMIGGPGAEAGSEEINSLCFWAGGDAILAVSNLGSLKAWWYPVEERPPLAIPEDEERPSKKPRLATEEPEAEVPAVEEVAEDREGERDAEREEAEVVEGSGEGEGADGPQAEAAEAAGDGKAPEAAADGDDAEPGQADAAADGNGENKGAEDGGDKVVEDTETAKADGDEKPSEDASGAAEQNDEDKPQATGEDVEMADAAPPTAPASAAPSAPATAPPSAPATAAPSIAPTPTPGSPAKDDTSKDDAANEAAAKEEAAKADAAAKKAAELEGRHRQLQQCFRKVPATGYLLGLALNRSGTLFAVGGTDARVSVLDTRDWIVQKTFDEPTNVVRQVAFSPSGEFLAVGGDDPFLFIFGVVSRTTVAKIAVPGNVSALAWHPKRSTLAYCTKGSQPVWYHVSLEGGDKRM